MLQSRCRHSNAIPEDTCAFCNSTPESLLDICFCYIYDHLETICTSDPESENLSLKKGVALPVELCEKLLTLQTHLNKHNNSQFINIFANRDCTRLKRVKIKGSEIYNEDLEILLRHSLVELEIAHCSSLTADSLKYFGTYGGNLLSLSIEYSLNFDQPLALSPELRRLVLKNFRSSVNNFYSILFPLTMLTHLDLSCCSDLSTFAYTAHLTNLTSLILYNVENMEDKIEAICRLVNLRHLDISQSKEDQGKYKFANEVLAKLVKCLPKLTSLDISGTNLAGRGVAEAGVCPTPSDIPGLSTRVENPFQFLGLYETSHDACLRHGIPAKLVAGNANEEQVLIAAVAYLDRPEMLQKVLNELFHLFRFESCDYVGQALHIVVEAMTRHLRERHIQISGSATLFYIVKGTGHQLHDSVRVKKKIITALLNAMTVHKDDDTMMRNGCLTLCQFKIPTDVLFEYERLVGILLHSVHGMQQESFVQRIGIYLLNSLACQVDGYQKVRLGELGTIKKMISLISNRLARTTCDDVLEVAWSTMWNVTDETPLNCLKFLENNGMEYFLKCLEKFPHKEELLRNMMGLLGNVAEVKDLRPYLVTTEYLTVFSDLLESTCDGIEVSYNAAGVISHIASDGPELWTVSKPTRSSVLHRLICAIERWDIHSQRNINYRSFEPILNLVRVYHTPECQRWACWALANLTKVYPEKYCGLVKKENGLTLLQELIQHPLPPAPVKHLAAMVVDNCRTFEEQGWLDSDMGPHLDG